jgi:hypothetical protein
MLHDIEAAHVMVLQRVSSEVAHVEKHGFAVCRVSVCMALLRQVASLYRTAQLDPSLQALM